MGREKHGMFKTPEYSCWESMKSRCFNKNNPSYYMYGAVGITICKSWLKFSNFYHDMGPRPSLDHSLDRFPNKNGNYEPGNVRWATPKEQGRNRNNNRIIEINGIARPVAEWAEIMECSRHTLIRRLNSGMNETEAIMGFIKKRPKRNLQFGGQDGLTVGQLSKLSGVSRSLITRWLTSESLTDDQVSERIALRAALNTSRIPLPKPVHK